MDASVVAWDYWALVPFNFPEPYSIIEGEAKTRPDLGESERQALVHGRPFRTPYAFDPRRVAILLIAGDKTGDDRWYDVFVPRADDPYDEHLDVLRKEGLI